METLVVVVVVLRQNLNSLIASRVLADSQGQEFPISMVDAILVGSLQAPKHWSFVAVLRCSGELDYATHKQLNLKLQSNCGRNRFRYTHE